MPIPALTSKPGVQLNPGHLRRPVVRILHVAQDTAPTLQLDRIVITSANDGKHGANSLHYQDAAFDLRVWNIQGSHVDEGPDQRWSKREWSRARARKWAADMQQELGDQYDVLYEEHWHVIGRGNSSGQRVLVGHIHAEWDPDPV
jgi:hypothetical protein